MRYTGYVRSSPIIRSQREGLWIPDTTPRYTHTLYRLHPSADVINKLKSLLCFHIIIIVLCLLIESMLQSGQCRQVGGWLWWPALYIMLSLRYSPSLPQSEQSCCSRPLKRLKATQHSVSKIQSDLSKYEFHYIRHAITLQSPRFPCLYLKQNPSTCSAQHIIARFLIRLHVIISY